VSFDATERELRYLKMTGDDNVPRGAVSWAAKLPAESEGGNNRALLPTVKEADLLRWCELPDRARWDQGTVEAKGRSELRSFSFPLRE
jgi:hypothetical protein